MFFDMNTDSKIVNSQTASASLDAAGSKRNEIDLIKRLEKELARSRVREEALMSLLKTKTEGSSTIESKEHVTCADPKRSTDWLIVDETSPTTASASNSLPTRRPSTSRDDLPKKRCSDDKLKDSLTPSQNGEFNYQPPSFQFHDPFPSREMRAPPEFINPYLMVHLPQLQLQKFTGNIESFPTFVQEFKAFVESQCFDDYRQLLYLQMYLVGEPANLIQSCSAYLNKSEGYSQAWEYLNDRYVNSFKLRNKVREELVSGPPIKDSDTIQLNYLATKMNSCKCLFEANGKLCELNAPEILQALFNRLSSRMQERFAEISFKREIAGESASFLDLIDLVSRAARFSEAEWARQLFQVQGEVARPMGKYRKPETRKPTAKTFAVAQNSPKKCESVAVTSCLFCRSSRSK